MHYHISVSSPTNKFIFEVVVSASSNHWHFINMWIENITNMWIYEKCKFNIFLFFLHKIRKKGNLINCRWIIIRNWQVLIVRKLENKVALNEHFNIAKWSRTIMNHKITVCNSELSNTKSRYWHKGSFLLPLYTFFKSDLCQPE
jgi:hypothetical protein